MEEIHPSPIFMSDSYFDPARPPSPKHSRAVHSKPSSVRVATWEPTGQGHGCLPEGRAALLRRGHETLLGTAPSPGDHHVPFLVSRSKVESSTVSQFVKPKSFNSTFSLNDAAFYMKIRASKTKQKFASSVYKLCTHAGNKHCPGSLQAAVKESRFCHLLAHSVRIPFPSHTRMLCPPR